MDPPPEAQSVESADISAQQAIRSETRIWTSGGLTVTWTLMEGHTLKNDYGGRFDLYDQTQPGSSTAAVKWHWCENSGAYYYALGVNGGVHFQLATNGSGSEGELDVYASGSGFLTCGTPKTTDETFIVGWDSGRGRWIDLQNSSQGSWGTGTAPGVNAPLTDSTDDA